MISVIELQHLINKTIVEKHLPLNPKELYEPIRYTLSLGGKRLRPVLMLMACDLFNGSILKALNPALGLEIFHNFTLLHDDIMDKAPLRRGKPTVHAKWSESVAILSGDVMLIEASKLIMEVDDVILREVLNVFNETAIGVCEGQQIDMNFEEADHVSIAEYMEMIRLKTAVLVGGGMKIGALIGGANPHYADSLYKFGENLGIAFQLQDDILDIYGNPKKFGKQVGGDILANKKTFLLINSIELAEGIDKEELTYWITLENPDAQEKIKGVTAIYNRLGIRQLAETEMNRHIEISLKVLEEIPADKSKKQALRSFAEELLIREN